MLKLTDAAIQQVKLSAETNDSVGDPLRLAAEMKEDGSIVYLIGFDAAKDDDIHVQAGDIEIVIEPKYVRLLEGATMDYLAVAEDEFRFIFMNPNDETYIPPEGS
ncbi:MAG: iron-sulfur cluster assembly accessory protein [Gammaproteobacteria bacterium]|nr:iron-sulfur cluster assembly accessory protein [Gammaproteobacteria bacterium]